jgi:hypothetical protein
MRIVINQYADGDKFVVETSNDGSVVLRELAGKRKPGARISAYVEVACDDNSKGFERVKESLNILMEEIEKRAGQMVQV